MHVRSAVPVRIWSSASLIPDSGTRWVIRLSRSMRPAPQGDRPLVRPQDVPAAVHGRQDPLLVEEQLEHVELQEVVHGARADDDEGAAAAGVLVRGAGGGGAADDLEDVVEALAAGHRLLRAREFVGRDRLRRAEPQRGLPARGDRVDGDDLGGALEARALDRRTRRRPRSRSRRPRNRRPRPRC